MMTTLGLAIPRETKRRLNRRRAPRWRQCGRWRRTRLLLGAHEASPLVVHRLAEFFLEVAQIARRLAPVRQKLLLHSHLQNARRLDNCDAIVVFRHGGRCSATAAGTKARCCAAKKHAVTTGCETSVHKIAHVSRAARRVGGAPQALAGNACCCSVPPVMPGEMPTEINLVAHGERTEAQQALLQYCNTAIRTCWLMRC